MRGAERRLTPRFRLRVPMAFHRIGKLFDGESVARAINISTEGVFFAILPYPDHRRAHRACAYHAQATLWDRVEQRGTTGRVVHRSLMLGGLLGVGVQLLCYELTDLSSPAAAA